ncbi:CoA transferase [Pilimelia anulata]|nr:CoA transferase [Pilimelia anulata]
MPAGPTTIADPPAPGGPLAGLALAGWAECGAARLARTHLGLLGAAPGRGEGPLRLLLPDGAVAVEIDWTGPDGVPLDETTAQAALGPMAVHGRARGGPAPLAVDHVTAAAGVLAVQGVLAGAVARLRGRPVAGVRVAVASAALLTVAQYLAAATAEEPEPAPAADGVPPPFVSADGVRFELETLDPEQWRDLWLALGVPAAVVDRGWRAFVLRYATGYAPIPAALHTVLADLPYERVVAATRDAGVAVQPVRTLAQRRRDPDADAPPWRIAPLPGAAAPRRADGGGLAGGPLAGLTVVEAGRRVQGPLAGHLLGLLGATVIRVEPAGGDPLRGMPPMVGGTSARFLALNRGKRVVPVDLRTAAGRDTVRQLARRADVLLHNWAPGKAAELGLDAADLAAVNPALVYAHASGWGDARGRTAPPGTDFTVQAYSGVADRLTPPGAPPAGSLMTLLDVLGGLTCAEGVLAGLVARERTGRGQRVDTSLLAASSLLHRWPCGRPIDPPAGPGGALLAAADGAVALPAGAAPAAGLLAGAAALPAAALAARLRAADIPAVVVCPDPGRLAAGPAAALLERAGCAFVRPPWRFLP